MNPETTTRIPMQTCPACGRPTDAASTLPGDSKPPMPEPGDLVVCFGCGTINVFGEGLQLAVAGREEWMTLPAHVREPLLDMQRRIRLFRHHEAAGKN